MNSPTVHEPAGSSLAHSADSLECLLRGAILEPITCHRYYNVKLYLYIYTVNRKQDILILRYLMN